MTKRSPLDPTRIIGSSKPLGFPSYWPSCLFLSGEMENQRNRKWLKFLKYRRQQWSSGTQAPGLPRPDLNPPALPNQQACTKLSKLWKNGRLNHWWRRWPWLGFIYNRVMERRSRNSWVSPDPDLHDFPTNLDSLETQDRRIANAIQSRCATRMTNIIWNIFQNCHKKIAFV